MNSILEKQKEFQALLKNDITSQEFKNTMFLGLLEEIVEVMKETPFKKHKKHQEFNKENFSKELVDVQIYLINLVLSTGMTWDEFQEEIKKKIDKNFERQKNGY